MARTSRLAFLIWLGILASNALAASTPREALIEIALAEDASSIEKHLPVAFVHAIQSLREPARSKLRSRFVFRKTMPNDVQITVGGADNLLLSAESKEDSTFPSVRVKVEEEATSASGTLLKLAACQNSNCETYYVQMKFEEGEWRVMRLDSASKVFDLEASELLRRMQEAEDSDSSSLNESSAAGSLRSINVALIQYQANYPEIGYPRELRSLLLGDQTEVDSDHAGLLDSSFACQNNPCRRSGYLFEYSPRFYSNLQGYAVIARPEVFGVTGTRSFYTDESGVIRFTDQDRPATEDDATLP